MRRPFFFLTNIFLPVLAVLAMTFVFWHWNGYPLPQSLASGKIGETAAYLRERKTAMMLAETEKIHRRNCQAELQNLEFAATVFACENSETGRWFVQFRNDGRIRIGLPEGATRRFKPSGENGPNVDLTEVFTEPATYQRSNPGILTIQSRHGPRHFRLQPDYSAADPVIACQRLTFEEVGSGATFLFQLTLSDDPEEWLALFPDEIRQDAPGTFPRSEPGNLSSPPPSSSPNIPNRRRPLSTPPPSADSSPSPEPASIAAELFGP